MPVRFVLVAMIAAFAHGPWAATAAAQQAQPQAAKPPGGAAVSAAEAAALAKQIDAAAAKGDLSPYQAAIDDDEIFVRSTAGMRLEPKTAAGLRSGSKIAEALAATVQTQVRDAGANYRLLRVNVRGGQPMPIFRFVSQQGLNYHELHLYRDKAGQVRIGDMLIFLIGETISQNMRNNFMTVVGKDGAVKLDANQQAMVAAVPAIAKIRALLSEGKGDEALTLYESLPAGVKTMKAAALMEVQIRSGLPDGDAYLAAVEAYRKRFPEAADVDLIAMDALFQRKDYDGVLAALDRLDKRIGGDDYLNLYRANVMIAKGDRDAAGPLIRKAVAAAPAVRDVHFALLELELTAGRFDEVARALTAATQQAGVQWGDLTAEPPFAEFVKSTAYADWKAGKVPAAAAPAAAGAAKAAPALVIETGAGGKPPGITFGGKTYLVGAPSADLLKVLGRPDQVLPPNPWTVYDFHPKGIRVGVDPQGKLASFEVYMVEEYLTFKPSGGKTREGVGKGATLASVKKVYGKPEKERTMIEGKIVGVDYRTGGARMHFKFVEGTLETLYVEANRPPASRPAAR